MSLATASKAPRWHYQLCAWVRILWADGRSLTLVCRIAPEKSDSWNVALGPQGKDFHSPIILLIRTYPACANLPWSVRPNVVVLRSMLRYAPVFDGPRKND